MERLMTVLDTDMDTIALMQVREVIGGYTKKAFTLALEGLFIDDTPGESAGSWFRKRRG